jgi:hypothetical protein
MHRAGEMPWSFQSALNESLVDDHLGGHIRQLTSLPLLNLLPHGFEVALHPIDSNGDAVDERERLRVLCQHRRELAQDNVSTFCVRLSESDVCTGSI